MGDVASSKIQERATSATAWAAPTSVIHALGFEVEVKLAARVRATDAHQGRQRRDAIVVPVDRLTLGLP